MGGSALASSNRSLAVFQEPMMEFLVAVVASVALVLVVIVPIVGAISAATKPQAIWDEADQSKTVWVLLQIFLGVVGTVAYALLVAPKLQAAAERIGFFQAPTEVLIWRYLAHILDFLFHLATAAVLFWLLADRSTVDVPAGEPYADTFAVGADRAFRVGDEQFVFERSELILIAAMSLGVMLIFFVVIQGRFGWTVGKLLTRLRTVNGSGERPGILRAFFRTLLLPIDALPSTPFIPLVGGLVALFTDTNRRIGDLVAGTFVVRRSSVGEDPTEGGDLDLSTWKPVGDETAPITTLSKGEALRVGAAAEAAQAQADAEPLSEPEPAEPTEPTEPAEADAIAPSAAPAYRPQWDPARQAYLQWDPRHQAWLQYDDDAGKWHPI